MLRYDVVWWIYGHLSGLRSNFKSSKAPIQAKSRRELTQASHTDKIKTKDTNSFRLLDHEIYGRIFNSKTADILPQYLVCPPSLLTARSRLLILQTRHLICPWSIPCHFLIRMRRNPSRVVSGVMDLFTFFCCRSHPRTATPWQVVPISLSLVAISSFTDRRWWRCNHELQLALTYRLLSNQRSVLFPVWSVEPSFLLSWNTFPCLTIIRDSGS